MEQVHHNIVIMVSVDSSLCEVLAVFHPGDRSCSYYNIPRNIEL